MPTPIDRPRAARSRGPVILLAAVVAAGATAALDPYASEREPPPAGPADPKMLPAPDFARWGGTSLALLGGPAPGFRLADVRTGATVNLDEFRGRPVVLLLSSYGCNVFCRELGGLIDFHRRYRDRVAFLFVAIGDAGHPDPDFSPPVGEPRPGESAADTRRRQVREGAEHLGLPFPTLLDADGEVEAAYAAFPKRLVVVGPDGRIVYDGGRGPAGGPSAWDLAEVERHLRAVLAAAPITQ